jgi:hypothetical protein
MYSILWCSLVPNRRESRTRIRLLSHLTKLEESMSEGEENPSQIAIDGPSRIESGLRTTIQFRKHEADSAKPVTFRKDWYHMDTKAMKDRTRGKLVETPGQECEIWKVAFIFSLEELKPNDKEVRK